MKRPVQKVFVLAVAVVAITLIAGCSEQNLSDTKKSRFIAGENIQLKKQLEQRDKEIEKLKKLFDVCQQKKEALEARFKKEADDKVSRMQDLFDQLSGRLRQENDQFKVQIEELQAQVEQPEESEKLSEENEKLKMEIGRLKKEIIELKRELEMHKGPTPLPHTD